MSLPLFALLQPYINGNRPETLFCHADQTHQFTNSMSHFSSADLTVVWTVVQAFALAARAAGYSDAQIRALGSLRSWRY